jgi:tetratricopeptide (TPR) repeat protein
MFEDDDDAQFDGQLQGDLALFESFLSGNTLGFIDSDRMEAIIDHYFAEGDFKKAKRAAEMADINFCYNPVFKLRIAQALSGLKSYSESLSLLATLEQTALPQFEVWVTYGTIFSQMEDYTSAVHYLSMALPLADKEDQIEIYLDISFAYQKMKDMDGSIEVLTKGLSVNPTSESLLYELGFTYDRVGRYQDSIDTYLKYIEENPYANMAWYNLGNAYSKIENFEKAIWAYDYSILIFDEFAPSHFNMGNAYLSLGKYYQAIERFKTVLSLEGDDPMALCYLGEAHEQLKEYDIALNYYRLSLEFDPNIYEAWLGIGIITDIQGKTKEAIGIIHKALDCDPLNASINLVLANAYHKIDDIDQARFYFSKSMELDWEDEEILRDYVFFLLGQHPLEALELLEDFQMELENNPEYVLLFTHTLIHLNRMPEALMLFSSLVAVDKTQAALILEWNPALQYHKDFVTLLHE